MNDLEKIFLLGVGFTKGSEEKILEFIATSLQNSTKKYYIVTPNPELVVLAYNNAEYRSILNNAKIALADGIGLLIASRVLGKGTNTRITGVDFMESLCKEVSKQPITVSFLGGGPQVAEKTVECLRKKYPGLRVSWVSQEFHESLKDKETDILFVAFGSPKQEIWISKNIGELKAKVVMGVGGAFDFVSGNTPRAPKILRNLGLEWLFRLFIQPWRIKRQLSLFEFALLVIKEKIKYK